MAGETPPDYGGRVSATSFRNLGHEDEKIHKCIPANHKLKTRPTTEKQIKTQIKGLNQFGMEPCAEVSREAGARFRKIASMSPTAGLLGFLANNDRRALEIAYKLVRFTFGWKVPFVVSRIRRAVCRVGISKFRDVVATLGCERKGWLKYLD